MTKYSRSHKALGSSSRGLFSSPLGGEEPVEVRAAGVSWAVLSGEDVFQDVVALTAGFVLAHQLRFEERGPTPLQGLHPSHVRLKAGSTRVQQIYGASHGLLQLNPPLMLTLQTRATLGTLTLVYRSYSLAVSVKKK